MELEQYKEPIEGKIIDNIKFEMFSRSQIKTYSHVECQVTGIFDVSGGEGRRPQKEGVLDLRLGVSNVSFECQTCGKSMVDCPGHFGHINLQFPCFNVGYLKLIVKILQIICKQCSELLLTTELKMKFAKILSNKMLKNRNKKKIFENILKEAKKRKLCLSCGAYNGPVKKINGYKIIHDCYKINNSTKKLKQVTQDNMNQLKDNTLLMQQYNADLKVFINKIQEPLTPNKVIRLFENIKLEYIPFFTMCYGCSPIDLIFTSILVPPSCIRPSVFSETQAGSNEDDLTIKLESMIWANNSIQHHCKNGSNSLLMLEDWEYLQSYVSLYINGELSGIPQHLLTDGSSPRGCMQRLKGKHGRFRGNLSGKRVDFSGRTVISPDPNLRIDQVVVPLLIAKIMTYPEVVNSINIDTLRKLVINGPDIYPGANYVINKTDQTKQFLKFGNRQNVAKHLRPGDIVERHMQNGDIVLFNRQPSLHRLSIMAHRALIMENRTFRFNECVCTPYNADFDGDEMNIHLPQTEEARAEAATLMGVKNNIITPRNGEPLIAATQDFITGAYLLSNKETFLSRSQLSQLISTFLCNEDINKRILIPQPAILKPTKLWTGKQAISILLSPFPSIFKSKLNLTTRTKSYTLNEDLCSNDGYCVIFNGEHVCGVIDKSIIGSGSKNTLFYHILREYGTDECCKIMWRFARITPLFLMNKGFSIGINDVTPSLNLLKLLDQLVEKGYSKCEQYIKDCQNGELQTQPGCSADETLEALILRELSTIRDSSGKVCLNELPKVNAPLIMAICGSKGSNINISQMVACVGQQALNGKRTPNGFEARTLPHFRKNQKTPDAKGFVKSSFYSGLSPTEFFFHTMAGREGLVDTAVKTAETGYMQRRLVKCLEDLCIHYDDTVRSASNDIIQFIYGGDGLDPIEMESDSNPVNFEALYNNIISKTQKNDNEHCLTINEIENYIDELLLLWNIQPNLTFKESLINFISKKVNILHYYNEKYKYYIDNFNISPFEKITKLIIYEFIKACQKKYENSKVEPGTAVGAICAQSIGEPGTQMTLKTFHFAGVATMNITLGVPRLKEIINATINISTPVITASLIESNNLEYARIVKARIEKTTLGDVCEFIEEIYLPNSCYLILKLDMNRIKLLKLEVNEDIVCHAIASNSKLKIKHEQLSIISKGLIGVIPTEKHNSSKYFVIQQLKVLISNVTIKGFDGIQKAIIHMDDNSNKNNPLYKLIIEGNDLSSVITTKGVDSSKVTSNNTHAVFKTLGIEAARATITNEIVYTMKNHGMSIDLRHVMLLADLMTYRGEVLGITRFGLSKMKESVLMLASFEKTSDHLFDAAYFGDSDKISGVSESIIMGRPMKLGTGLFKLLQKTDAEIVVSKNKNSMFEEQFVPYLKL